MENGLKAPLTSGPFNLKEKFIADSQNLIKNGESDKLYPAQNLRDFRLSGDSIQGDPMRIFSAQSLKVSISIFFLFFTLACKTTAPRQSGAGSGIKGLSATANAENIAVLMTAYSYTPSYGSLFEEDLNQFYNLITDPAGNYRFKTIVDRRAGHERMLSNIRSAASQVSENGTLLLFITAHGAATGQIQPEDQRYVTIGYPEVLQAIRDGRNGQPFRRFVLFISACYSGSWMQNLQQSDGLFRERLVISSVGPNQLSWIAKASRGMMQAFNQLKDNSNATLQDLINQAYANVGEIQYHALPQEMMSETLVNPTSNEDSPTSEETNTSTTTGPNTTQNNTGSGNNSTETNPDTETRVKAITQMDPGRGLRLYAYYGKKVTKVEMKTGSGWWTLTDEYLPQTGYESIWGTLVIASWANERTVDLRLTLTDGTVVHHEVTLEHR